jgi:hypothetical protein
MNGLKINHMVKVIVHGRLTTTMKKNQVGVISKVNPRRLGLQDYHRCMNRDLIMELMTPDQFVRPAVTIPLEGASQLFGIQLFKSSTDSTSQDSREETLAQVILKPYDPSSLEFEGSNA